MYADDIRYMSHEQRAAEGLPYRAAKPSVRDQRAAYYAAVERMAAARKDRDVKAFHRHAAKARELLAKLP